jgi:transposase
VASLPVDTLIRTFWPAPRPFVSEELPLGKNWQTLGRRTLAVARYGQPYKDRVVARLLPPESSAPDVVSREVGVSVETGTLAVAGAGQPRPVSSLARAANAGRQRRGWRRDAIGGLGEPRGASVADTRQDRRRIKELERELHRKDKALAETAALLVLSKTAGDLPQGRGRMTRPEDRQTP